MKPSNPKPAHVVEAERREKADLASRILALTSRIPKKVLQEADQRGAARFKQVAFDARKVATSAKPNLGKLRAAYLSIEGYYREQ